VRVLVRLAETQEQEARLVAFEVRERLRSREMVGTKVTVAGERVGTAVGLEAGGLLGGGTQALEVKASVATARHRGAVGPLCSNATDVGPRREHCGVFRQATETRRELVDERRLTDGATPVVGAAARPAPRQKLGISGQGHEIRA
jgi:hypothetical protein